jgi:NAD(P)-dependent dehydrogenase (short-subunit alcohol dehydrogenase family)
MNRSTSGLLHDKVAIVVGASRGIGAATSRAFAAAGAKVAVASRDEKALEALAGSIRETGGDAFAVRADIRDAAEMSGLVERVLAKYGRLDLAFNNAGTGNMLRPFAEMTIDEIDESLSVNLRGTLVAMKFELAAMLSSGGGAIVNMSSTAGLQGARGLVPYSAAKHAIVGATKSAALDYAARNIRLNVVAPGPILNDRIASLSDEQRAPIARAVPMQRIGRPEEIADAVVWLCSDHAGFITGTVLSIDGGRLAGWSA